MASTACTCVAVVPRFMPLTCIRRAPFTAVAKGWPFVLHLSRPRRGLMLWGWPVTSTPAERPARRGGAGHRRSAPAAQARSWLADPIVIAPDISLRNGLALCQEAVLAP